MVRCAAFLVLMDNDYVHVEAINYYSKCDCVKYIYIIWSEETPPSQSLLSRFTEKDVPRVRSLSVAAER